MPHPGPQSCLKELNPQVYLCAKYIALDGHCSSLRDVRALERKRGASLTRSAAHPLVRWTALPSERPAGLRAELTEHTQQEKHAQLISRVSLPSQEHAVCTRGGTEHPVGRNGSRWALEEGGVSSQSVWTDLSASTPISFALTHTGLHCWLPGSQGEARCPAAPAAFRVSLMKNSPMPRCMFWARMCGLFSTATLRLWQPRGKLPGGWGLHSLPRSPRGHDPQSFLVWVWFGFPQLA